MHLATAQPGAGSTAVALDPRDPTAPPAPSFTPVEPDVEQSLSEVEHNLEQREEQSPGEDIPASILLRPEMRTYPWHEKGSVYALQHGLQNFDLCLPRPLEESGKEDTVWVIFIHGGAWRDPTQDKAELQPALSQLLSRPEYSTTLKHIAGFASPNYGLSTFRPEDESAPASLRVQHNQHIVDIVLMLSFLEEKYDVGTPGGYTYVIVGHSAGATLAFQSVSHQCACATFAPARAIVGLAGIYDLPSFVTNHKEEPFYEKIVRDAFTDDEQVWRNASPVNARFEGAREKGGLDVVVLGASDADVLVEKEQRIGMKKALEGQGWKSAPAADALADGEEGGRDERNELVLLELEGTHDEIWERGDGVRKGIELVIARLFPGAA